MRVLLDESLPRKLKEHLPEHTVFTVPEIGWAGKKNGELLRIAEERFDVFLTPDAQLPDQQNLAGLRLSIIVVSARSSDIADLIPLIQTLRHFLARIAPGQVMRLSTELR